MEHAAESQRGVAILIVLILVTLMSLLAVNMNGLFVSNFQRAEATKALQTQQWIINSEEKRLLKNMTRRNASPLSGLTWRRDLNLGETTWHIEGKLESAQRCFNLNRLASVTLQAEAAASEPYQRYQRLLMDLARLSPSGQSAADVAQALLQRFAALQTASLQDKPEAAKRKTYLYPENALPAVAQKLLTDGLTSPLCLLPSRQARVDINQLTREQAPLLAALFTPYLSDEKARALIAARPDDGWKTLKAAHEAWMKISDEPSVSLSLFEEMLSVQSHFWRSEITVSREAQTLTVSSDIYFAPEENLSLIWNHRYVY